MVTRPVQIRSRWFGIILLGAVLTAMIAATIAAIGITHGPDPQLNFQADRTGIPAGGATAHLTVKSSIPLPSSGLTVTLAEGLHSARVAQTFFDQGIWHVSLQSKVLPGKVRLTATLPPFVAGEANITVIANSNPDVLRLDDPADESAFRSWFTFLAEAQFFHETSALPPEISDCAGMIRYAYREALRTHDTAWAKTAGLPLIPAIPSVRKYEYPYTPWGAALFRTGPVTRAEFADAATLLRYNTHLVSREIREARPGDLLFFHHEDAVMPYHSMIYLGPSQIESSTGPFVIYHTGPQPGTGEIRRPTLSELQKHPDPAWQPSIENTHYLGVYRWNILR